MSELRWLTFTSCCFIAYYCALLSSRSRFRQLQSSQGTRRGWATRSWWGYWWGTYRKPHIIHTHQPQHVTPNEASAAFKWLIAHCLQLSLDPLLILRSGLSSNSSWLALASLGIQQSRLPGSQECFDTGPDWRRGKVPAQSPPNIGPSERRGWVISEMSAIRWGGAVGESEHFLVFFISCLHLNERPATGIQAETFWTRSLSFLGPLEPLWCRKRVLKKWGHKSWVLYSKLSLRGKCTKLSRKLFLGCKPFPITYRDSGRPVFLI